MVHQDFVEQEKEKFGEQLSKVPSVKRIVLRDIYDDHGWILPADFGMSSLHFLEELEITDCILGPYFNPLLTSGRLTSLTINFPWVSVLGLSQEDIPNTVLAKLTTLKLVLHPLSPLDPGELSFERAREMFLFLERTYNLEVIEFQDAFQGFFFDTFLLGFLANTDGTLLCPRLRNIRLSHGLIIFPLILIRLLQQRSRL
jgi:hypothetical protein